MRVCVQISTGKLIEMQSGNAELGTLLQNAVSAGYAKIDVEEKYVTAEEYQEILDAQPRPSRVKSPLEILQETVDQLVLDSLGV